MLMIDKSGYYKAVDALEEIMESEENPMYKKYLKLIIEILLDRMEMM